MNDDVANQIIAKLNDLQRQINALARLDVVPTATVTTYSGTPTVGQVAYWTGAGTVAGAGTAYYDSANGRLGVGGTAPVGEIETISVSTSNATRGITTSQHNSGVQAAIFSFHKSRGTRASQTTVANGDFLGDFVFAPYDGANYLRTAQIAAKAVGAVSTGTVPTDILFAVGDGDDGSLTNVRMTIKSTGLVGIGEVLPGGQLQVEQSSTTGAVPTLWLRQADLSEEFIRFESTVGAGNALNTTAAGTYYGRARVWVEGVGEKWISLFNA